MTLISGIPPFLLKTPANPEGVDGSVCEGIKKAVAADRPAFLAKFCADFHNVDLPGGTLVSDEAVQASWNISVAASPQGCLDCVDAWLTDLRGAGGPHGIAWTHADQVNSALLTFLAPEAKEN